MLPRQNARGADREERQQQVGGVRKRVAVILWYAAGLLLIARIPCGKTVVEDGKGIHFAECRLPVAVSVCIYVCKCCTHCIHIQYVCA